MSKPSDENTVTMRESQVDEILLILAASGQVLSKQQLLLQLESRLGCPIEVVSNDHVLDEDCVFIAPRYPSPNTIGNTPCEHEGCKETAYYSSQPPKGAKVYCDLHLPTPKPKHDA
ncbi:hypothetical protein BH11ARM2_BH11ARM2_17690 [soil metagenome]